MSKKIILLFMKKLILVFLAFIVFYQLNAQTNPAEQRAPEGQVQSGKIRKKSDTAATESPEKLLKGSSQYLIKQIMKWTSPQSYVTVPFSEQHLGNKATIPFYLCTADIYPNFFIGSEGKSMFMLALTPRVNLRLDKGEEYSNRYKKKLDWNYSQPVRTPSYMPEISLYVIPKNGKFQQFIKDFSELKTAAVADLVQNGESTRKRITGKYNFLKFTALHHSNGQDGSHTKSVVKQIFETLSNRPDSIHIYTGGYPTYLNDRFFNIYNGNFANDLVIQGYYSFGNLKMGEEIFSKKRIDNSSKMAGKNTFHVHRNDIINNYEFGLQIVPFKGETLLKERYGLTKLLFRYQHISATYFNVNRKKGTLKDRVPDSRYESWRIVAEGSLALNSFKSAYNWNNTGVFGKALTRLNAEIKFMPNYGNKLKSNSASAFISIGWKGQDDYNIYLEDSFAFVKVGFALGYKIYEDTRNKKDNLMFESQTVQEELRK